MSEKKPRFFISNPESGEPACYIGDVTDVAERASLRVAIGHFIEAEIDSVLETTDKSFSVEITRHDLTDEEVENLPDY